MIEAHADVRGYFRERLMGALARRGVQPGETTEFYLVDLLARFATGAAQGVEEPLVYRLAEALETREPHLRFRRFREMGDAALYALGFFFDHLHRRGISRRYVVGMGEKAYARASDLAGWSGGRGDAAFTEAFEELAGGFDEFARALDDVREATTLRTPQDIVRLYDRWRRNGSPVLAERLQAAGVYPQTPGDGSGGSTLH